MVIFHSYVSLPEGKGCPDFGGCTPTEYICCISVGMMWKKPCFQYISYSTVYVRMIKCQNDQMSDTLCLFNIAIGNCPCIVFEMFMKSYIQNLFALFSSLEYAEILVCSIFNYHIMFGTEMDLSDSYVLIRSFIWKWKRIVLVSIGICKEMQSAQDGDPTSIRIVPVDIHTEQHEDPRQEPSGQSQDKGHAWYVEMGTMYVCK